MSPKGRPEGEYRSAQREGGQWDPAPADLDGLYAGAQWVAQAAHAKRPFASPAALTRAMVEAVREAPRDAKLALLREHATRCAGGDAYEARFGFPFVLATAGPRGTGLSDAQVDAILARRIQNHPDFEFAEGLREVHRIAELRLSERLGVTPALGNLVWDWAERLAAHSDPGYAERGVLTVTYLTDAHRACAADLSRWMRDECGFDEVSVDAVGNVVGVYRGTDERVPRLLTGSHYDTVRNGGRYDGRLGILVPMACVRELARERRRLPFAIEVVGFAEEEGQRYKAVFLGSGALTGHFDMAWLDQADADGITMREAMARAGLRSADIPALARDPSRYRAFVEVHIEQGPVLNDLDLPLGVVTSINGGVRYLGEIIGTASHAGTTPMGMRQDAAAAVAELVLYLEHRASEVANVVGTVGMLEVPNGSINVIPGRCRFSLDIRSTTDPVRDACVDDVLAELRRICDRRGVRCTIDEAMRAAAAPSDPAWQARWERAVEALGLPVHRMPSGAGHDAMKLAEIMPQAMLFVRGINAGISHNPLEGVTAHDADLAVQALRNLVEGLA
jgi:N-carbamoyl-L-amino-acid hydrolase